MGNWVTDWGSGPSWAIKRGSGRVRDPTGGSCLSPLTRVGWGTTSDSLFQNRGNGGSGHTACKTRASAICTKNKRFYGVSVASPASSKFLPACTCWTRRRASFRLQDRAGRRRRRGRPAGPVHERSEASLQPLQARTTRQSSERAMLWFPGARSSCGARSLGAGEASGWGGGHWAPARRPGSLVAGDAPGWLGGRGTGL